VRDAIRRLRGVFTAPLAKSRLFKGVEPLSSTWGANRGLPIHRYYLEQFLKEFSTDIKGHCLEFQGDDYVSRVGGFGVKKVDILHVDNSNPKATLIADLSKDNALPSDYFDCVVCTHVLHVIYDFEKAVGELWRILKPGGSLLIAVPQLSMCGPEFHELWRFTAEGLSTLLAVRFGKENVSVRAYGNSLTSAGEIRGLVADEFSRSELDYFDERFAVEICARAVKRD
jgi:SAM-dependent methyltransferase